MQKSTNAPRHRAKAKFPLSPSSMLATAGAIGAGSLIAVLAAGGTYAQWNGTAPIADTTINSGTLGITVNGQPSIALAGTAWSKLLPGDVISQQVTVKNTGNISATVTLATTGTFGPLLVHGKKGACSTTIAGTSSTVSPTALGTFTGGESSLVCLQVTLPATVANVQGANYNYSLTFAATQGP